MSNVLTIKDKVNRFASALFQVELDSDGDLRIPIGSTLMFVRVIERFDDTEGREFAKKFNISTTLVRIWAPVLIELKGSPELFKWVATEGQELLYGSFALNQMDDGTYHLVLQINIPGDEMDQSELNQALMAVGFTADGQDEDLQKKFGGKRIEDINN
jgi:hypothetical protein